MQQTYSFVICCCVLLTVKGCKAIREEVLSSRRLGAFIPDCTEEGLYVPLQCHGSTGYCWCVNEMGEEILETRRGPGEDRPDGFCEGRFFKNSFAVYR